MNQKHIQFKTKPTSTGAFRKKFSFYYSTSNSRKWFEILLPLMIYPAWNVLQRFRSKYLKNLILHHLEISCCNPTWPNPARNFSWLDVILRRKRAKAIRNSPGVLEEAVFEVSQEDLLSSNWGPLMSHPSNRVPGDQGCAVIGASRRHFLFARWT